MQKEFYKASEEDKLEIKQYCNFMIGQKQKSSKSKWQKLNQQDIRYYFKVSLKNNQKIIQKKLQNLQIFIKKFGFKQELQNFTFQNFEQIVKKCFEELHKKIQRTLIDQLNTVMKKLKQKQKNWKQQIKNSSLTNQHYSFFQQIAQKCIKLQCQQCKTEKIEREKIIEKYNNLNTSMDRLQQIFKLMQKLKYHTFQPLCSQIQCLPQKYGLKNIVENLKESIMLRDYENLKKQQQQQIKDKFRKVFKKQLTSLEEQRNCLKDKIKQLDSKIKQKEINEIQLKNNLQKEKKTFDVLLAQKNEYFKQQIEKKQKQHQIQIIELNFQKNQVENLKEKLINQRVILENKFHMEQKKNQQLAKKSQEINKQNQTKIQSLLLSKLFNYKIKIEQEQTRYLITQIKHLQGKQIAKTSLLYAYDSQNKANFHRYIDNHQRWIIIIKTLNGRLIGGYSQQKLSKEIKNEQQGFIFCLTNSKNIVFPFNKQKQKSYVTAYDLYYLIFGNSQLRLKVLQLKLFSNFGIINSFYKHNNLSVNALIGQGEKCRQIDILTYQIYQIQLQQ